MNHHVIPNPCLIPLAAVAKLAIEGVIRQGRLPISPCQRDGERILLCGGAWVVRAGLFLAGRHDEVSKFESDLLKLSNPDLILETATELGLPVDAVRMMIKLNDSLPDAERVNGVVAQLSTFAPAPIEP